MGMIIDIIRMGTKPKGGTTTTFTISLLLTLLAANAKDVNSLPICNYEDDLLTEYSECSFGDQRRNGKYSTRYCSQHCNSLTITSNNRNTSLFVAFFYFQTSEDMTKEGTDGGDRFCRIDESVNPVP